MTTDDQAKLALAEARVGQLIEAPDDREACSYCEGTCEGCDHCDHTGLSDRARWRRERRAGARNEEDQL